MSDSFLKACSTQAYLPANTNLPKTSVFYGFKIDKILEEYEWRTEKKKCFPPVKSVFYQWEVIKEYFKVKYWLTLGYFQDPDYSNKVRIVYEACCLASKKQT